MVCQGWIGVAYDADGTEFRSDPFLSKDEALAWEAGVVFGQQLDMERQERLTRAVLHRDTDGENP